MAVFNQIPKGIPFSEGSGIGIYYPRTFLLSFLLIAINISFDYVVWWKLDQINQSRVTITKTILSKVYHRLIKTKKKPLERTLDESSNDKAKIDKPLNAGKKEEGYDFDEFVEDMASLSKNKSKKGYEEI